VSEEHNADWRGLQAGDYRAFERVYKAHAAPLIRYGRQFAELPAVEDAVQSLFIRLWDSHSTLNLNAKPRPYLLISLRNDLLRHRKFALRMAPLENVTLGSRESVESEIVESELAAEQGNQLAGALAGLSERERELVDLRFSQGMEYADIVEITGISYQSARNTLARAIGKLRERLSTFFWAAMGTSWLFATYPDVKLFFSL